MKVIAFTGKKGVGKNFVADITRNLLEKTYIDAGSRSTFKVEYAAFADPMKKFLIENVGVDAVKIHGNDKEKNTPTGYRWENFPSWLQQKFGKTEGDVTIRHTMQIFGTELNREIWDREIWVKAMQRRIAASAADWLLITDCRYQNEIDSIRAGGGKVWRIDGIQRGDESEKNDAHSSEIAMDSTTNFDYNIENNPEDTPDSLKLKVIDALHASFPDLIINCDFVTAWASYR